MKNGTVVKISDWSWGMEVVDGVLGHNYEPLENKKRRRYIVLAKGTFPTYKEDAHKKYTTPDNNVMLWDTERGAVVFSQRRFLYLPPEFCSSCGKEL